MIKIKDLNSGQVVIVESQAEYQTIYQGKVLKVVVNVYEVNKKKKLDNQCEDLENCEVDIERSFIKKENT